MAYLWKWLPFPGLFLKAHKKLTCEDTSVPAESCRPLTSVNDTCGLSSNDTSPEIPVCERTACCKFNPSVENAAEISCPSTDTGWRVMYAWF